MVESGKNIAVMSGGAVGAGIHGQGIPAVADSLRELAVTNNLTVYSRLTADPSKAPSGIRIRSLPFRTPWIHVDLLMMALMLVFDHSRRRYNIIHAISGYPFGWVGVQLGRLLKVPCLVVLLGGQELANLPGEDYGDLRIKRRFRRIARTCERAEALVALSDFQAQALGELGISPHCAEVIPFGVDTSKFPYSEKPLTEPFVFLHISYSVPIKDMRSLINTFRIISGHANARLVIIGQDFIGQDFAGQDTLSLVRAASLQSNVEIVGSVPNSRIAEYMKNSHFLLHTSRYESQGVVFNEAMACGTVVCSTSVGIVADLGGDYCISAAVGDCPELADRVLAVIGDPERYRKLRSNGYRWSTKNDVRWTAARYREIYQKLS